MWIGFYLRVLELRPITIVSECRSLHKRFLRLLF